MAESILRVVSPADLAEQERLANESPTGEDGEKKEFSQLVAFIRLKPYVRIGLSTPLRNFHRLPSSGVLQRIPA